MAGNPVAGNSKAGEMAGERAGERAGEGMGEREGEATAVRCALRKENSASMEAEVEYGRRRKARRPLNSDESDAAASRPGKESRAALAIL